MYRLLSIIATMLHLQRRTLPTITLCFLILLFSVRQVVLTPWRIDPTDFLIRPLLLYALPLLIVGLLLLYRPHLSVYDGIFTAVLCLHALLVLNLQTDWPRPNLPTSWEDSSGKLFVLEVFLYLYGLPLVALFGAMLFWERRTSR